MTETSITRRRFLAAAVAAPLFRPAIAAAATASPAAGRRLHFLVEGDFGGATPPDIEAVARSAAQTLWRHCPNTHWQVPGFCLYHSDTVPICLNAHRSDGRIAIGLAVRGTYWSQLAYQFAHEFCHALAGHSNDWRAHRLGGPRPNHWLEEALCETASLFALRAMAVDWRPTPPYPNWRSYAEALEHYAGERMDTAAAARPAGTAFEEWFARNEAAMRRESTLRDKNNVVALHLLPLFESEPAGWESVTFRNLSVPAPDETLASHFADWRANASPGARAFIQRLARKFGIAEGQPEVLAP